MTKNIIAVEPSGEILIINDWDEDEQHDYQKVFAIPKFSTLESRAIWYLSILIKCQAYSNCGGDQFEKLINAGSLEYLTDKSLRTLLKKANMMVYRVGNNWAVEKDYKQYRLLGESDTLLKALLAMRRVGS